MIVKSANFKTSTTAFCTVARYRGNYSAPYPRGCDEQARADLARKLTAKGWTVA